MNRRQEIALFLIVAAFVATLLFPPWIETIHETDFEMHWPRQRSENEGYHFLFRARQGSSALNLHSIDWGRLLLADLIIVAVGGCLLYTLRSKS